MTQQSSEKLPTWAEDGNLNVLVETPKGSRNKLAWNEKHSLFELKGVLPAGAVFPYDFGFVPSTRGEDGDPIDLLIFMDEPSYPGTLVKCRLLGVIEAEQTEDGETERNDRLLAVAAGSRTHGTYKALDDVDGKLLEEIEHFFKSYNQVKGKEFRVVGRGGPERARELIEQSRIPEKK